FDRERRSSTASERRMAVRHGLLEILRIVIAPADDDQVLEAAGDEELAGVQEPEIAGAQETLRPAGKAGAERALRQLRLVPVAAGDARAGHPDLVLDDGNLEAEPHRTATDPLPETVRIWHQQRSLGLRSSGNEQRRLGETVAGEEGGL